MSQQLQITGGAKVRSLEGVITGSTGVLGSLPINGANGIPQLDSNGKILVSQLPNSVMEYLGTWNVTTNTPYLVNGTGNAGDVYLVEGAATGGTSHDFGAGAITFYNGDQVIYSGSIWQRGAGSSGTVTSVAITESGDALTITGSPITNSGTINIGFAGTSAQYVAGNGALVTFPALTGYVPYTGATATLDMGSFDVNARGFKVNGTAGSGHVDFKHQSGTPTGSASSTTLYADTNGDMAWKNDHNYITTFDSHSNTADRIYTLPNASGTVALTSDLSAYVPTSRTLTINGVTYDLSANRTWTISTGISGSGTTNYLPKWTGSTALGNSLIYDNGTNVGIGTASPTSKLSVAGTTAISGQLTLGDTITNGTYTYTLPGATGVLALTSDLTIYVTLGTLQTITGTKIYSSLQYFDNNVYIKHSISGSSAGYTTLGASTSGLNINLASGTSNNSLLFASTSASNTYTFPNATGTLALTSDIPSLTGYISGSGVSGRIPYFNGTYTQTSSANLSWDNTNNFISTSGVYVANSSTNAYMLTTTGDNIGSVFNISSTRWGLGYGTSSTTLATAALSWDSTGKISIGNTNSTYNLDVTGTGRFTSSLIANIITSTSTGSSQIFLKNTGGGSNRDWQLQTNEGAAGDLSFMQSTTAGGATYATKFNIGAGGKVSISALDGESLKLQLATSTGNNYLRFYSSAGTALGYVGSFYSGGAQLMLVDGSGTDLSLNGNANLLLRTGGTERMRITSAGNVGIGTSDPQSILSSFSSSARGLAISNAYPFIGFNDTDGGNFFVGTQANLAYLWNGGTDAMIFATNNAERMRITSGGYTKASNNGSYQGATASHHEFNQSVGDQWLVFFQNTASSPQPYGLRVRYRDISGTGNQFLYLDDAGGVKLQVLGNGNVQNANNSYGAISDINLKENITDASNKLNDLLKVKIRNYNLIADENKTKQIGVIAQELEDIFPNMVETFKDADTKEEYKSVKYSVFVPMLIKAIQELKAEIDELKNK